MNKKKIKAVISGYIIDSSSLSNDVKEKFLSFLKKTVNKIEIYKGDNFQFITSSAEEAFKEALCLKLALNTYQKNKPTSYWDVRLAIGIGPIESLSKRLAESDGTAFRLSGRLLTQLEKQNLIAIHTIDENFNEELETEMAFINHLIAEMTFAQKEVVLEAMKNKTQDQISKKIGINQSTVNRHLKAGGWHLIKLFDQRFRQITKKIETL